MRLQLEEDLRDCDECLRNGEVPVQLGEMLVGDKILCFSHYARQAQPIGVSSISGLGALFG